MEADWAASARAPKQPDPGNLDLASHKLTRHRPETTIIPEICAWQAKGRKWLDLNVDLNHNGRNLGILGQAPKLPESR